VRVESAVLADPTLINPITGQPLISKARLMDIYGLTAAQATAFFASEITLRLGIRGSAQLLHVGHFRFNVRFLSD
jgi:hypothetical protein